jgi:hypothetical protein
MFQETRDRQNFQTRYVLRHPWKGSPEACEQAKNYFEQVAQRQEREARVTATLTGWSIDVVRKRMGLDRISSSGPAVKRRWWLSASGGGQ